MDDLKISLVQFDQIWENKEANKKTLRHLLNNLVETDLLVLPEMLFTGFSMNIELAENMKDSESINFLLNLSKEKDCAIYTSILIKEDDKIFNRGIFIFPNGEFQIYDKRKLFSLAKEDKSFDAGQKECVVEYKTWKINLQICYDLRFPEISRNYILEDGNPKYDICIYVANWPEKRAQHWKSLLVARAIENQAFVIGVNRIGRDGNSLNYSGDSCAISPIGVHLFESIPKQEFVQTVVLKSEELLEVREKLNFLKDGFR